MRTDVFLRTLWVALLVIGNVSFVAAQDAKELLLKAKRVVFLEIVSPTPVNT